MVALIADSLILDENQAGEAALVAQEHSRTVQDRLVQHLLRHTLHVVSSGLHQERLERLRHGFLLARGRAIAELPRRYTWNDVLCPVLYGARQGRMSSAGGCPSESEASDERIVVSSLDVEL